MILDKSRLIGAGIAYDEGLARCMGDAALYHSFLRMFLESGELAAIQKAFAAGDLAALEREAHSLKGVGGNLSLTVVYELASRITTVARSGSLVGVGEDVERLGAACAAARAAILEQLGEA